MSLSLMLSACATTGPTLDPEALIPKALTTCTDAPPVPPRPAPTAARSDADKAKYLSGVTSAYRDCKDTVAAVAERRRLLDEQAEKAKPWWERMTGMLR